MKVCVGLLVVFFCETEKPAVIDNLCPGIQSEVAKFKNLTEKELAVLQRPRKEAILSLRRKYAKCQQSK